MKNFKNAHKANAVVFVLELVSDHNYDIAAAFNLAFSGLSDQMTHQVWADAQSLSIRIHGADLVDLDKDSVVELMAAVLDYYPVGE